MKIRFKQACLVKDGSGTQFEEGHVYDLPLASAEHWLRRGKAEPVVAEDAHANPAKNLEDADETRKSLAKREAKKPEPPAITAPAADDKRDDSPDFPQTREGTKAPDALKRSDIKLKK